MNNRTQFEKILVFSATYNESGNIEKLVDSIWKEVPSADILIVDDNSPDGTGELLDEMAAKHPKLKPIHRPGKLGLGSAHHLAMIYAIQNQYDALITMDADLSHDPKDIQPLLEKLVDSDFVIGSRYMKGGHCDYDGYRKNISVLANIAARNLLSIPLHEFTTSFRAFRVKKLETVNFTKMHNQGYSFFMESVYRLHQAGLQIGEVPIHFYNRFSGSSKIPPLEIFRGIFKLLHLSGSKMLGRTSSPSSTEVEYECAHCGSPFVSLRYSEQLDIKVDESPSNAFRCSSMGHDSKPKVAKCLQCGLDQVPTSEQRVELEELYSDVVDQEYIDSMNAKKKTFRRAYQQIAPHLPEPGKVLEIGSYCGLFLQEAKSHGWEGLGIEPSKWAGDFARKTFDHQIISGNLEAIAPTLDEKFDLVASWDVLEHVRNPTEALKIMHDLLNPGGILAISTLDSESLFARVLGQRWPWIMEMHLFYFGKSTLKRMFEEAGFDVVLIDDYSHYTSLKYAYNKLRISLPAPLGGLLGAFGWLIPDITAPVTLGDIKLYVGKKRES